jgi:hypothetical protein
MTASQPPRRRRHLLPAVLAVLALLAAAGAVTVLIRADRGGPAPVARTRPPLLPAGGMPAPYTFTDAQGRLIVCPTGSEPTVMITAATFDPPLTGGSVMVAGRRYRIRLSGTVDNETGAAVDVRRLFASVRDVFWPAHITVVRKIPAQSSVRITVDGSYTSRSKGAVRVATHLDWHWHDPKLAGCDENGLVHDD